MEHHLTKAENKGYRCDKKTIERTVIKLDTIRDHITHEIVRVDTLYQTETETRYLSRYVSLTRQQRKSIQDSMRHVERMKDKQQDSLRRELTLANRMDRRGNATDKVELRVKKAIEKIQNRKRGGLWWFIFGVIVGVISFWQRKNIFKLVRKLIVKL
jgi:uncharacterized protein YaaN involved in tellurite resistance